MGQRPPTAILACIVAGLAGGTAHAAETAPRGWITTPDGPKHELTGVVCPKVLGSFPLAKVTLDGDASMLGRCHYPGNGMESWLRVREHHMGSGESARGIAIDNALMKPEVIADPLAMGRRLTQGVTVDGRNYIDSVVTMRIGSLLVDCINRQFDVEHVENGPGMRFIDLCTEQLSIAAKT